MYRDETVTSPAKSADIFRPQARSLEGKSFDVIRWLYNLIFNFALVIAAPFYFVKLMRRGGWRENFGQRWGIYDAGIKHSLTNREIVWLHAVSVGEVNLCLRLVQALETRLPYHKIVVSTTTSTGMAELKRRLPASATRIYYPIDRHQQVQRALGTIHPVAMVLIESELWPNMLWGLQRRRIPYYLVNARLSDRSFRRHRKAGFLFRPLFAGFSGIGAQTPEDVERLHQLGARPEAIQITGSLKFDASPPTPGNSSLDVRALLGQLGVKESSPILIGGSTHAGEEIILARIAQRVRKRFPSLFLILVPRHQERGGEVGKALTELGMRFVYRSLLTRETSHSPRSVDCLLVNTTGELRSFYACADVVFIGKSLTAHGGQNPIEPAALGKAVVVGPNMENFSQITDEFLQSRAILQVKDESGLEQTVIDLLSSEKRRNKLGRMAADVVRKKQGGLEKTMDMIVAGIKAT